MYEVIGSDGKAYGPVDLQTLRQWCREGRVVEETQLVDPMTRLDFPARELPDLADVFAEKRTRSSAPPDRPTTGPVPGGPIANTDAAYLATMPSPRNKWIAAALAFVVGTLGIHRFYLGHNGTGLIMLLITVLTCGFGGVVTAVWAIIDIILIFTGGLKDAHGRDLVD